MAADAAEAADAPMKTRAPAVQYVKVCSPYGVGFYYIPGTDTCLKIGGYVRVDFQGGDINGTAVRMRTILIHSGQWDNPGTPSNAPEKVISLRHAY